MLCVSSGGVACFGAANGEKRWQALTGMRTFEPLLTPEYVMVGSTSGLQVLSRSNGTVRWRWPGAGHVFSPATDGQTVYVTDRAGHVAALSLSDGEPLWQRSLDGWLYTPALVGDLVVTGGRSGVVHALARDSGETVWTVELDQELVFRPVATGDGVVVTTFAGSVIRLDAQGRVMWKARDDVPSFSPATTGELLLLGGMDGVLRARDARTGRLRWRVALSGKLSIPAGAHGDTVAAVSPDGELVLLDAANGGVLRRTTLSAAPLGSPVWADGWRVPVREAEIIGWAHASGVKNPAQERGLLPDS